MGDMNPFWQSLDQVFGQYFNATVNETNSDYTSFFHPVSLLCCVVLAASCVGGPPQAPRRP